MARSLALRSIAEQSKGPPGSSCVQLQLQERQSSLLPNFTPMILFKTSPLTLQDTQAKNRVKPVIQPQKFQPCSGVSLMCPPKMPLSSFMPYTTLAGEPKITHDRCQVVSFEILLKRCPSRLVPTTGL